MNHSGDDIDKILIRGLKQRFDESEAPVNDALYERIRKRIGWRRHVVIWSSLLAVLIAGLVFWQSTGTISSGRSQMTIADSKASKLSSYVPRSAIKTNTNDLAGKSVDLFVSKNGQKVISVKTKARLSVSSKKTGIEKRRRKNQIVLSSQTKSGKNRANPASAFSQQPLESVQESGLYQPFRVGLLESLPYRSKMVLKIPEPKTVVTNPAAKTSERRISWVLAFSPMQNFQTLRVQSTPLNSYRGIRFPSALSLDAKAFKLSLGAKVNGFELLAHYTYSQNKIFYGKGLDRYEIEPVLNGANKITEITTNEMLNEQLHRIGIGINKTIALRPMPLRSYELTAGVQFDRTLNSAQNVIWVNGGLLKRIHLNAGTLLALGPYAQIGLNNQRISLDGWQYRPLQIGVTATIRLNSSKFNHSISR